MIIFAYVTHVDEYIPKDSLTFKLYMLLRAQLSGFSDLSKTYVRQPTKKKEKGFTKNKAEHCEIKRHNLTMSPYTSLISLKKLILSDMT